MSALMQTRPNSIPAFCEGIQYFADRFPEMDRLAAAPVLGPDRPALADPASESAIYQTLLAADALRYLTLQITGSKSSGHPGGFASSADAVAALHLLGHRNLVTEVGHHAPGFYSAMFLDTSLEAMGIRTVADLRARFRERHGLLGHLSGAIPGLLAPAGPLGQGQHFAMAGALLNRDKLFPVTIGDGGLGEPYIMSAFQHFATAYPEVTNYPAGAGVERLFAGTPQHGVAVGQRAHEPTTGARTALTKCIWSTRASLLTTRTRRAHPMIGRLCRPMPTRRRSALPRAWPSPAQYSRPPTALRALPCRDAAPASSSSS